MCELKGITYEEREFTEEEKEAFRILLSLENQIYMIGEYFSDLKDRKES